MLQAACAETVTPGEGALRMSVRRTRRGANILTFPEDWMPLIIAKQTMTQAASKQTVIFQFKPPLSEMELEMSSASLYQ